jgi:FkbM family methyltransferase
MAHGNKYFIRFLKKIKLYEALKKIYWKTVSWILVGKIGISFRTTNIGEISIQGRKFKFYDPQLKYLPRFYFGRGYEPSVTYHLKTLIDNRKACFLDIGAHFGFFTSYVGTLSSAFEIYSFEPNKKFYEILKENVRINNIDATLYNIALSDEEKEIPFADRSMKIDEKNHQIEKINSIPFDSLRNREDIFPEVVKIDVHGGEGKVLYGMKDSLKHDVQHVYCELHPTSLLIDYTIKEVLDVLLKSGFELYELDSFRNVIPPSMKKLDLLLYGELIDEEKWTKSQITNRRMIYATKE